MLTFPATTADTSVSCSTNQIDALGSLLKYGLPGLALGIFLAALALGVAWKKVNNDPTPVLKVMLGFGLGFLVVGGLFGTYLSTRNPQVHVEVMVDPNPGDLKLPLPEIRSKLSSQPDHDMVLVQDADYVKVDITGILRAYDSAQKQQDGLIDQLASVEKSTSSAIAAARMGQADSSMGAVAAASSAANPVAAAADKACTREGGASCGWAPFARGDIVGAQEKFQQVALDVSAVQPQKAAAYKGLGYTYVAQGKPREAAEQFKRSSELGDREAMLQLKAINAATAVNAAH
ncbi:MAG TPA: tetratricopeptide repeat protein [Rhodanobacter sp.]